MCVFFIHVFVIFTHAFSVFHIFVLFLCDLPTPLLNIEITLDGLAQNKTFNF